MTFKKPIPGRTFLPDNAVLDSTFSDTERVTFAPKTDRKLLAAYLKEQEINSIMRQRHGVNM